MPLHDWSPMPAGLFHDFHQTWSIHIRSALNGILPKGFSALVEQRTGTKEPDIIAVERLLIAERPVASITYRTTKEIYTRRANRIVVKHHLGQTVAAIEIVSPGNKDSPALVRDFVNKTIDLLRAGIHVFLIDLFPPTSRDPLGLHKLIWDEISSEPFDFPPGKDRILASYETGAEKAAYVEPIGVGDPLPSMALFLVEGLHVKVRSRPPTKRPGQLVPKTCAWPSKRACCPSNSKSACRHLSASTMNATSNPIHPKRPTPTHKRCIAPKLTVPKSVLASENGIHG